MSLRSRASRWGRWGGVAALVMIAGMWVVSGFYSVALHTGTPAGQHAWFIGSGMIGGCSVTSGAPAAKLKPRTRLALGSAREAGMGVCHWQFTPFIEAYTTVPLSQVRLGATNLWVILVLFAFPTALLWRRHLRRLRPGHCRKCRYDLTGITGPCPECGA